MLWHTGENKMIKGLILSLQFFTRIPINIPVDFKGENIRYSIFFLPLIGLIIGGLSTLVFSFFGRYSLLIGSFLGVLTSIIITGGLHLDGLSDTFDGFLSNSERDRTLEIMRDSRIGAFGVLSMIILILFKIILLYSLEALPIGIVLSFINSRISMAWLMSTKEAARDEGLGKIFTDSNPKKLVVVSLIIYLLVLILINPKFIIALGITLGVGEYISYVSWKKINGLTGDIYGAIIEIGDTVSLFSFWGVMIWIL